MKSEVNAQLKSYQQFIEAYMEKNCFSYKSEPQEILFDAMRYSVLAGGKRLRPIFVFDFCRMCGGDWKAAAPFAAAIEMVHTYSLIHDDLPCMDNDDLRRGKPSCHKAFGESTALLAGDALIGLGVETIINDNSIADHIKIKAVRLLTKAMGPMGMIFGQELDLEHEDKPASKEILNAIHRHKTGRMISLCGQLGSIDSELNSRQADALKLFFENVGLVFQIVDDILDVEGDQAQLGKPVGSDNDNNKSTFITLYGLEESKRIAAQLTEEANVKLKAAFGDKSDMLIEYTSYLLNRKK